MHASVGKLNRHHFSGRCSRARVGTAGPVDRQLHIAKRYGYYRPTITNGVPMTRLPTHALTLARPAIQVLTVLNLLYGCAILAFFVASWVVPDWPAKPLGYDPATMHAYVP